MSRGRTERMELLAALEREMRKASAQGVLYGQAVAERLGVNSSDLECLDIVILRGPVTAGELALATGLTTGAITGVIDRLERAGYARREPDANDRRKVRVLPLPGVERRMQPLFEPMQRGFAAVLARYSDRDLKLLLDFITRAHAAAIEATEALRAKANGRR